MLKVWNMSVLLKEPFMQIKGYCTNPAKQVAAKRTCHLAAIKKNNMKEKNKDCDR